MLSAKLKGRHKTLSHYSIASFGKDKAVVNPIKERNTFTGQNMNMSAST